MSDFELIEDLRPGRDYRDYLIKLVRDKANQEAATLDYNLSLACKGPDNVIIVVTHVPPYPEASWHEGRMSDSSWLPWFTSLATGKVLDTYAQEYPNKKFIVLTGHSHSPGIVKKYDNLIVYTGRAIYGAPDLAGIIDEEKIFAMNHMERFSWKPI
jgi:Icc-related predicted phosphoesterase